MAISLEAFLYAITSNETGPYKNPYGAKGPWITYKNGRRDRAYGRYQIMGDNIPRWSKQYLGKTVSIDEYMASPDLQERLSRAVLTDYYNKHGARGAAAMWFSGSPNPNSNASDGHWTVRQYVAEMEKAAAKWKPGMGGSGGSSAVPWDWKNKPGGGSTPGIDRAQLAEQYGFVEQLFNSIPELKSLFDQAVAGTWDAAKFIAKLKNTNWWKNNSKAQRDYIIASFNDPATWRRERDQTRFRVNELGAQLGFYNLMGNQQLMDWLVMGVNFHGWTDAELKYQMANFLTSPPEGGLAGAGGQFQMKMASMAWANGIRLDQNWYTTRYRNILKGISSEAQVTQEIRNMAKAMFPGFVEQIDAGVNMADIASPYLQGMSSILELNPGELDLFDPTIKNALNYKDPKTGSLGAMPLWQYEVNLRKDPRWTRTNNAREGLMGVAHKVAQDFGVLY